MLVLVWELLTELKGVTREYALDTNCLHLICALRLGLQSRSSDEAERLCHCETVSNCLSFLFIGCIPNLLLSCESCII